MFNKCLTYNKVVDSRTSKVKGVLIRRRRECLECGNRFSPYEVLVKKIKGEWNEIKRS